MQSSPTLEKAYQHVCQYGKIATDMFQYTIQKKGDQFLLNYETASAWMTISPGSARQAVEQAMSGTLHVFELLSAKIIVPSYARFVFSKPKSIKEYERIFQCPLEFNASQNQLVFNVQALQEPVISYDKSLYLW
jgi:hypothetical protein